LSIYHTEAVCQSYGNSVCPFITPRQCVRAMAILFVHLSHRGSVSELWQFCLSIYHTEAVAVCRSYGNSVCPFITLRQCVRAMAILFVHLSHRGSGSVSELWQFCLSIYHTEAVCRSYGNSVCPFITPRQWQCVGAMAILFVHLSHRGSGSVSELWQFCLSIYHTEAVAVCWSYGNSVCPFITPRQCVRAVAILFVHLSHRGSVSELWQFCLSIYHTEAVAVCRSYGNSVCPLSHRGSGSVSELWQFCLSIYHTEAVRQSYGNSVCPFITPRQCVRQVSNVHQSLFKQHSSFSPRKLEFHIWYKTTRMVWLLRSV